MTTILNLVLREIIATRQQAYETTIAEDHGLLEDVTIQGRRRMAIEVRLGEKEILAMAAEEINNRSPALNPEGVTDGKFEDSLKRRKL